MTQLHFPASVILRAIAWLSLGFFAFCFSAASLAESPAYVQYTHRAWRIGEGEIADEPSAIAQTPDGYIWVGTLSGLFRFDGAQFEKFERPGEVGAKLASIFALTVDSKGALWIGTDKSVLKLSSGNLTLVADRSGRVNGFQEDRKGQMWLARTRLPSGSVGGLCQIDEKTMVCRGSHESCSSGTTISIDVEGAIWIGSSSDICRLKDGVLTSVRPDVMKYTRGLGAVAALAPSADGSMLVGFVRDGMGAGLERLADGLLSPVPIQNLDSTKLTVGALLTDREQGLWIGTESAGVIHVHDGRVDRISTEDGLSGATVETLFEDSQGNIWASSNGGLDCFSKSDISSFGVAQGIANNSVPSVLALKDGRVLAGGRPGLTVISKSGIEVITKNEGLPGQAVSSLLEARNGTIWLGVEDHLVAWRDNQFSVVQAQGVPFGPNAGMAEDSEGNIWVLIAARPFYRIFKVTVKATITEAVLPKDFLPNFIGADKDGTVWAASAQGELAKVDGPSIIRVTTPPGHDAVSNMAFSPDATVWLATEKGLKAFSGGRWRLLSHENGLPCDAAQSVVHAAPGALWIQLKCGFFSLDDKQLRPFLDGRMEGISGMARGVSVGARQGLSTFRPSATVDSENRLWFANEHALQMIDAPHLPLTAPPPPVHIESISVDGQNILASKLTTLPQLTREIAISYAGLDFKDPSGVQYRYRLNGDRSEWTNARGRRTALFSNLAPGNYQFQVTSSSRDGVWNEAGDSFNFVIPPAFYQTIWFRLLLVLLGCFAVWGLMTARVRRASAALEARMMERLAERSRIARELHDTLLQSIQSTSLHFQNVVDGIRDDDPVKKLLFNSLAKADHVIDETRAKVQDLRAEGRQFGSIIDDVNRIFEELRTDGAPTFQCTIIGTPLELKPEIRDEVAALAHEVILNAVKHASAATVTCEVRYSVSQFVLICQDDGTGIPPNVLSEGRREGHWGLPGIRERGQKINAALQIRSNPEIGTRVSVRVDGKIAYAAQPMGFRYFRTLFRPFKS